MPAVFDSMAEGISKGYEYISFKDSMRSYIQASGSNSADQWTRNVLKTLTDEDGNPLGTTALMRLENLLITKNTRVLVTLLGQRYRRSETVTSVSVNARKYQIVLCVMLNVN